MILSGRAIIDYVKAGLIEIEPGFDPRQVRPFGLRLHLADQLLLPIPGAVIDPSATSSSPAFETKSIDKKPFTLEPGAFILGSTIERIRVNEHVLCFLDGRSTLARVGMSVHCTSFAIDSNTDEARSIVLEMKNDGPFSILLKNGLAIGMLMFSISGTPALAPAIQSQYRKQKGVVGPNLQFQPAGYRLLRKSPHRRKKGT